jgi:hypothetical protein
MPAPATIERPISGRHPVAVGSTIGHHALPAKLASTGFVFDIVLGAWGRSRATHGAIGVNKQSLDVPRRVETATFYILTPYHGTVFYKRMQAAGRLVLGLRSLRDPTRRLRTSSLHAVSDYEIPLGLRGSRSVIPTPALT